MFFTASSLFKISNIQQIPPLTQVRLSRIGSRTALLPRDPQVKPPAARDLVYLAVSPDFCHLDPDNGIPGTAGRRCNGEIQSHQQHWDKAVLYVHILIMRLVVFLFIFFIDEIKLIQLMLKYKNTQCMNLTR